MRYLIWKLNWDNPKYGTGPEQVITEQGCKVTPSIFANPDVLTGQILGYLLSGDIDLTTLSLWQVTELSQAEALDFAKTVDTSAYLLPDGVITIPAPEV